MQNLSEATWSDLTEQQPEITMTPIEQAPPGVLAAHQQQWLEHGFVVLDNLIPNDVLDAYSAVRERLPSERRAKANLWGGWPHPTPYMSCPEMRDVLTHPSLQNAIASLIAFPVGVHLALTGWVSTERAWHQDSYLNPDFLWSHYAAVWIALDDISEDSGPFECVPGSHRWETMRRQKLFAYLTPEQRMAPDWPTFTQGDVARVCEEEMARRDVKETYRFTAKKGEVLIWHSNLVHRGSPPKNPDLLRKGLIGHYSSIVHRLDMERLRRNENTGQLYFDLPEASPGPSMSIVR